MRIFYFSMLLIAFAILAMPLAQAQPPQRINYQAVIRNNSNQLITNQQVSIMISILQGTEMNTVYVEVHATTTNANGLVTFEIGSGATTDDFAAIEWGTDQHYIKVEVDPEGGTNYTLMGVSQLLSVPYALHAKTAETVLGGVSETDPIFTAWDKSTGISITESQITNLGNYIEQEGDPVFSGWNRSTGISITENQITDLKSYLTSITGESIGDLMDVDLTGLAANKVLKYDAVDQKWVIADASGSTETDPVFTAWDKSTGISITEAQISDLQTYLISENDPAVSTNFDFTGAVNGDLLQFNGTKWVKLTPTYISHYTVTEGDVKAHQAALEITENQISDLKSYITEENDPAVTENFDFIGSTTGDLLQFNGTKWVKFAPNYAASVHTHNTATPSADGFMSSGDKSKLNGIQSGAEVNVNADWNAISGDALILNKPQLSTVAITGVFNDLLSLPLTYPPSAHNHSADNITSGTLSVARGGTGATNATDARLNLGATSVGSNIFTLNNPSAISFLRINANNSLTARSAAELRSDIGAGTVTSIATNNGITGGTITSSGSIGLTGQALALHNLATNGLIIRNGASSVVARSISVSGNGISISNGNGVSGNPTISLNIGSGANQVAAGNHAHDEPTYTIGLNNELGGYVFYVTPNGKHGLVAATQDQGSNNWYVASDIISIPDYHNTVGKNFTNWRLPTYSELCLMHNLRTQIGGFQIATYWSSMETSYDQAFGKMFDSNGEGNQFVKTTPLRIRAIRSF
jgi:hypothetical protein